MAGYKLELLKVLVVDDNEYMRHIVRTMLLGLGVSRPREAAGADDAFARMADWTPDVVITDLQMAAPTDGIDFVRKLRRSSDAAHAMAGVVMMTAHGDIESIRAARDAGVTEFLVKPISVRMLAERITAIVERPRAFVRCDSYVGPDRRRNRAPPGEGPCRRHDDSPEREPTASNLQAATVQ
jgi:two-component system, chemotaxis family, chemotaxis protein CheY